MKYFNEHRRRLINSDFRRGTKATVLCEGSELPLPSTSGSGFETIEIQGNTEQKQYQGYNLFDVETKTDYNASWTYNGGGQHSCPLNLEVGKEYTISWEQQFFWSDVYSGQANLALVRKDSQADTNRESLQYLSSKTNLGKSSYTFVADGREMLWFYASGFNMTTASLITALFAMVDNIQIVEGTEIKPYEEYTGGVPTPSPNYPQPIQNALVNVICNNDAINTDIQLCGIGDYKDSLIVDWKNKTVKKYSKIKFAYVKDLIDNNLWWNEVNGTYTATICGTVLGELWASGTEAYCTHCPYFKAGTTDNVLSFELYSVQFTDIIFYNIEQSTKEDFVAWLTENDVQIAYALECEDGIVDDVTDKARELLSLTTPHNQDATLDVLGASKIKATYYSLENEDKLSITVHCVDEEGNSLRESEERYIRKDSLYTLIPPTIHGYESLQAKFEGYLTENTEITIIYEEI